MQEIGHAALAAVTPRPEVTRRNISLVVGHGTAGRRSALQITCVDAYTGERCVVTRKSGDHAGPGRGGQQRRPGRLRTPTHRRPPVHGRRGERTGTHLDLLAGRRRVLILALTDGSDMTEGMMTSTPATACQELEDLEALGHRGDPRAPPPRSTYGADVPPPCPGRWPWGPGRPPTTSGCCRPSGADRDPRRPAGRRGPSTRLRSGSAWSPRRPPPRPARPRPGRGPR